MGVRRRAALKRVQAVWTVIDREWAPDRLCVDAYEANPDLLFELEG